MSRASFHRCLSKQSQCVRVLYSRIASSTLSSVYPFSVSLRGEQSFILLGNVSFSFCLLYTSYPFKYMSTQNIACLLASQITNTGLWRIRNLRKWHPEKNLRLSHTLRKLADDILRQANELNPSAKVLAPKIMWRRMLRKILSANNHVRWARLLQFHVLQWN